MTNISSNLQRGLLGACAFTMMAFGPRAVQAQTVSALTSDGKIIEIMASSLATFSGSAADMQGGALVTGLASGQVLVGIDYRPFNGKLYGLGYNFTTGAANVYIIQGSMASAVGGAVMLNLGMAASSDFDAGIGFDFNPVVDRIRVVAKATGANYRLNPETGAIAGTDANLSYAAGTSGAGLTPRVSAVAYSNNFAGTTTTALAAYDGVNLKSSLINPPNAGTIFPIDPAPSFPFFNQITDFDIFSAGLGGAETAFYTVYTGQSTNLIAFGGGAGNGGFLGSFGAGRKVTDIAIKVFMAQPPALMGRLTYGLTLTNQLITFDSDAPEIIRSSVPITGIPMGQIILAFDVRPSTGQIYVLAGNPNRRQARLYTLMPATGVATGLGAGSITLDVGSTRNVGMDFDPVADVIRVVSTNNLNARLSPVTGALSSQDGVLKYAPRDIYFKRNPAIGACSYSNNRPGATSTMLFGYDDSTNSVTVMGPGNSGQQSTRGFSGIYFETLDGGVDLDFLSNSMGLNELYASGEPHSGGGSRLYKVNQTTGRFTLVGFIGGPNKNVREIAFAIMPGTSPVIGSSSVAIEEASTLSIYPNPAADAAMVSLAMNKVPETTYNIVVTDQYGRRLQVRQIEPGDGQVPAVDVSALGKGIYMIQVQAGGKTVSQSRLLK